MEEIIKVYSGAMLSFLAGILFIAYLTKACIGEGQIYIIIAYFFDSICG